MTDCLRSAILRRLTAAAGQLTNLSEPFLRGPVRWKSVAHTRFAIMLVAREHGKGPSTIGQYFRRDHSSVIHGIKRAHQLEQEDEGFAELTRQLRLEVDR